MTSKQAKWSKECQKTFDPIQKLVSRETLLSHPGFNEKFELHTDAGKQQLESEISQRGKSIVFHSRKLVPS